MPSRTRRILDEAKKKKERLFDDAGRIRARPKTKGGVATKGILRRGRNLAGSIRAATKKKKKK